MKLLTAGKNWAGVGLIAIAMGLAGCNGGSSDSSSIGSSDGATSDASRFKVAGPLDAVQTPVDQLLGQVAGGLAGTPLEGTVDCVNKAVVGSTLDILDSVTKAVQAAGTGNPGAAFSSVATDVQGSLMQLSQDLPAVLSSLAGGNCSGNMAAGNPLAGTPLAPLGDALRPVLAQIQGKIAQAQLSGEDLDLSTVSGLLTQLNTAVQGGLSLVPEQATTAPVVGGLLVTLGTTLNDLDQTVQALGNYDSANTSLGISITVNHLLSNVLTQVVPVAFIEEQAGQGPIFSSQINNAITQVGSALYTGLQPATDVVLSQVLDQQLAVVLDPVENTILPTLLGPITDALAGVSGGSGGPSITGTPLDAFLAPITSVLGGATAGGNGQVVTGTPLDLLLGPIAGVLGGAGGTAGSCPLAGTPLEATCDIVGGLMAQLPAGGPTSPLELTNTLTSVLSGLGLGGLLGGLGA